MNGHVNVVEASVAEHAGTAVAGVASFAETPPRLLRMALANRSLVVAEQARLGHRRNFRRLRVLPHDRVRRERLVSASQQTLS
jgi:hypothetical protein